MVRNRDESRIHFHHMLDVRTVDPHVAGTQTVRSPAGDHGDVTGGRRDGFTRHKSSSHRAWKVEV
jgi:hypothetical protein